MKLYKTSFFKTPANGAPLPEVRAGARWTSSASDASKARTELKKADRNSEPETTEVDVDTSRPGLIAFLNTLSA